MQSPTPTNNAALPATYINHGGGPLPLMGRPPHIAKFLGSYLHSLPRRPKAIVMVTAHWETKQPTVASGASPSLMFDYGGFPPETYQYQYPAPGDPELARRIVQLLSAAGIKAGEDSCRGWDHGVFVPAMLLAPDADIPIVAMSIVEGGDPSLHIRIGAALESLRSEGVLIVGSGVSFHNFRYIFGHGRTKAEGVAHSLAFDRWLNASIGEESSALTPTERRHRLEHWTAAPSARACQPRGGDEHMPPLFVTFGAGGAGARPARRVGVKRWPCDGQSFANSQFEFRSAPTTTADAAADAAITGGDAALPPAPPADAAAPAAEAAAPAAAAEAAPAADAAAPAPAAVAPAAEESKAEAEPVGFVGKSIAGLQKRGAAGGESKSVLRALIAENAVVLVGAPGCGYCARAKSMLGRSGVDFKFYELGGGSRRRGDAERKELDSLSGFGPRTVPYLWVNGKYAGGCNDGPEPWMGVRKLIESGQLKQMLAQ